MIKNPTDSKQLSSGWDWVVAACDFLRLIYVFIKVIDIAGRSYVFVVFFV